MKKNLKNRKLVLTPISNTTSKADWKNQALNAFSYRSLHYSSDITTTHLIWFIIIDTEDPKKWADIQRKKAPK